jgi:DNA-binding transcriptional MerR regulator
MGTDTELFTIGQLAARTGLEARTIRFWSDAGLVPPAGRSASGYRLYDAEAMARLELVRTLRELGLGLDVVRAVLSRAATLAQVAAAHVAVLDEQIRILRLRRAVLSTVATRGNTIKETQLMHQLARLSAQQRQQMTDDFVAGVFAGANPEAPGAGIARGMRQLPAELPDDPVTGPSRGLASARRGSSGTGSSWRSSTTGPRSRPRRRPSSGSSRPCRPPSRPESARSGPWCTKAPEST